MQTEKLKMFKRFLVLLSILCFLCIMTGVHNIDNSLNMLKISYDEGIGYYYNHCDRTALGGCFDYDKLYIIGQVLVNVSSFILIISVILLYFLQEEDF